MIEAITSVQNKRIKDIVKLQKSTYRRKTNLYIIEGLKEVKLALTASRDLTEVYYCPELCDEVSPDPLFNTGNIRFIRITREVYQKIAYRENRDGILAVARQGRHELNKLQIKENPLLVILESVEKPGNLGAILRTADAAGIDALIIADSRTDIYNPNVIRSSLGCVFTVPLAVGSNEEVLGWLKKNKIKTIATTPDTENDYDRINYSGPVAILMGTESEGLSSFWLENADKKIKIPMHGKIDSLNVSTSAAIVIFEAVRQRKL